MKEKIIYYEIHNENEIADYIEHYLDLSLELCDSVKLDKQTFEAKDEYEQKIMSSVSMLED